MGHYKYATRQKSHKAPSIGGRAKGGELYKHEAYGKYEQVQIKACPETKMEPAEQRCIEQNGAK